MDKKYYDGLHNIIMKQFNGDATWTDVVNYRESCGVKTTYDYVQRGTTILCELLRAGYTLNAPTEDGEKKEDIIQRGSGETYNASEGTYTYDKLIEIVEGEIITPELVMQKHNIDPKCWKVVTYKNNFWNSQAKEGKKVVMYQSKLVVKPITQEELNLDDIKKHFEDYKPTYKYHSPAKKYTGGSEMLVPCFFDVHFSKLAHADETGEHYDYKIAKQRVIDSAKNYMDKLTDRSFEKILFVIGNDYFNSESDGATFNNTKQDNDSRYSKMFKKGVETLIEVINMFSEKAPVEVVLVPGNHDTVISFYAACVLEAFYRNDENVTVDCLPKTRKYHRYGTNLIGLTHGSEEKNRIYGLMQVEAAKDWGETTTHEWLIGHLHKEGVTEDMGVVVRRIPSLTGTDAWHSKMGYTMSNKKSCAFIYHKDLGLTDVLYQGI